MSDFHKKLFNFIWYNPNEKDYMLFLALLQIVLCDFIAWHITFLQIIAVFAAPSITRNTTDVSLHRRCTLAKSITPNGCWDISKETQIKREWNTNPQATCEDNFSWCWALVRLAASPPELATPESHYSSRPASGDKVQEIGLLRQHIVCKSVWVERCVHAAHQFHQLFGLADLLGDGHKLVVAHE